MRKSKNFSISLPAAMLQQVDRVCQIEHRNRSELIREALREYLARVPVVEPTTEELAIMASGRSEIAGGAFVSLEQLRHDLAIDRRQIGAKKPGSISE